MVNRTWYAVRWIPLVLFMAGMILTAVVWERDFETVLTLAIVTLPLSLGMPILSAVAWHRVRKRKLYTVGAYIGGGSIAAMLIVTAVAALLWTSNGPGHASDFLYIYGTQLLELLPYVLGGVVATAMMIVSAVKVPQVNATGEILLP